MTRERMAKAESGRDGSVGGDRGTPQRQADNKSGGRGPTTWQSDQEKAWALTPRLAAPASRAD